MEGPGQTAGGAGEVVRDRPQYRPRGVGSERSRRQMGRGGGGGVGDVLLGDRVIAVLGLGLQPVLGGLRGEMNTLMAARFILIMRRD